MVEAPADFLTWCHQPAAFTLGAGTPFDLTDRRFLLDLYADQAQNTVIKKAAQMGFSTFAILRAIYRCEFVYPLGVLYLLPTDTHAERFSKAKIAPLLADNPRLANLISDTDSVAIKRVGNRGFLYAWGTRATNTKGARLGLKSFSADELVLDERDEMEPSQVALAHERMSDSLFQRTLELSTPLLPDTGVDASYQASDQRAWFIRCDACGRETCLELTWPDCLRRRSDGSAYRACSKCGAELNPRHGRWEAQYPGREVHGYWISQLCSVRVDPTSILDLHESGKNATVLHNDKLGMAYVEAENRLSLAAVLACCGSDGLPHRDDGPCSMGIDRSPKEQHVTISKHLGGGRKLVWLGVIKDLREADGLMERFGVTCCVADAMPDLDEGRAFQRRHPRKVWLNFYSEHQRGSYAWNEEDFIVSVNRTESLDASHAELQHGKVELPRQELEPVKEFARHCRNIAKRYVEDPETGSKIATYIKLSGPDHYRHAFNYDGIALARVPQAAPGPARSVTDVLNSLPRMVGLGGR